MLPKSYFGGPLSIDELNTMAGGLSNFNGALSGYNGQGDDLFDFSGGEVDNFGGDSSPEKSFQITFSNSASTPVRFFVWNGYNSIEQKSVTVRNAAGTGTTTITYQGPIDGLMRTGTAIPGKGGTGAFDAVSISEKSLEELMCWLQDHPTVIRGLHIQADTDAQLEHNFVIRDLTPFQDAPSRIVQPGAYRDQNTQQTKLVKFVTEIFINDNKSVEYSLAGNSVTTITFYFGAAMSRSKTFEDRAKLAKNNIKLNGGTQVAKMQGLAIAGRR